MPGGKTVAVKLLEPVATGKEAGGYWGLAGSAHAKAVFAVEADTSTDVAEVKARIAEAKGIPVEKQRVLLFGKELDAGRTLGSYGLGNLEDPLLHLIPHV
mmetsp:Transcript_47392/g.135917  ORF Transcript_47392/g.135917 Transcript_47392/m.135917 type:complete len:100 (-) Transcript_47392:114-413(-)